MIVLHESELVSKRKWIDREEFLDMVAIAESTPGPIAINAATYIGYKRLGFLGALAATVGVCIPSFVIIYLISLFFDAFLQIQWVGYAFRGIQAAVAFLIFNAGIKMLKKLDKSPLSIILLVLTMGCLIGFSLFAVKFSTIFYILIGGTVSVVIYLLSRIKRGDKITTEKDENKGEE
jgi:chromate transporter